MNENFLQISKLTMSPKFKIVIVVFGLLALLYVFQFIYSFVTLENEKDRKLANIQESFDELPNDTPAAPKEAPKAEPETKTDTKLRIEILDAIDKAYTDLPNASDFKKEKPVLFDKLLAPEMFDKLKTSANMSQDVMTFIKSHFDSLKPTQTLQNAAQPVNTPPNLEPIVVQTPTAEKFYDSEMDKVVKLKDSLTTTITAMQTLLEDINPYLGTTARIEREASLKNYNPPAAPVVSTPVVPPTPVTPPIVTPTPPQPAPTPPPIPQPSIPVPPPAVAKKTGDVIEGFENIRNFASF